MRGEYIVYRILIEIEVLMTFVHIELALWLFITKDCNIDEKYLFIYVHNNQYAGIATMPMQKWSHHAGC